MKARDFLTEKEVEIVKQLSNSVNDYVPLLKKWVDSGMPYNEHLTKAMEQKEWIDNFMTQFEIL